MTSDVSPQSQEGDEYFCQGLALAKKGLWKEALAAYRESLQVNPGNAQTYLNLGFVYYELGYDREAQEAFGTASRLQARPCVRE
jgi:tetratricopeptide (TPR) repeat protein